MLRKSRVAVLLATFNGEKYIQEFLNSLVKQTFTHFTLFVRDDGSTDATLEIVRSYSSKLDIEFIQTDARLGPAKSFMSSLCEAGNYYDYYFLADQDDYWYEYKIARAIDMLAGKNLALYCSRLEYVDENLSHIKYSKLPRKIALENAIVENIAVGCTMAMTNGTRSLIVENLPDRVIMHDWWFYIVAAAFGEVIFDEFPTIKYRQHGNNTIGAATNVFQDARRRIVRFLKHDGGLFRPASQADEFIRCYKHKLSNTQLAMLQELAQSKGRPIQRIKLAFHSIFFRQSRLDTFILRILFLLGRY